MSKGFSNVDHDSYMKENTVQFVKQAYIKDRDNTACRDENSFEKNANRSNSQWDHQSHYRNMTSSANDNAENCP